MRCILTKYTFQRYFGAQWPKEGLRDRACKHPKQQEQVQAAALQLWLRRLVICQAICAHVVFAHDCDERCNASLLVHC